MEWLLFAVLVFMEAGLAVYGCLGESVKKEWTKRRLFKNAAQFLVYLVFLLFPGIDFGFRFKGLFLLLVLRLFTAGIFCLIHQENNKVKKKAGMIFGALGSALLILLSMIPAFVFRDYKGRPLGGSYPVAQCSAILVDRQRLEGFETDGSCREVPVHFYYPDRIKGLEEHSLPLILFSHGAFGYYQSNTSTYMELASHGYVVVSMDHPYHAFFTKDSDGKLILASPDFLQTAMDIGNRDVSEAEVFEVTSKWIELRKADMNFVLDTIKAAVSSEDEPETEWVITDNERANIAEIIALVDTEKIGLMGHSLGGATAVSVGRREDVSAVVDLDGTMLGEEIGVENGNILIDQTPYGTPLLCFDSESHHADRMRARESGVVYVNNVILDQAENGHSTYIEGAAHMNFTDLPLFAPALAKMLGMGTVDPEECIDIVNQVTLSFFDCCLKGNGEFEADEKYEK